MEDFKLEMLGFGSAFNSVEYGNTSGYFESDAVILAYGAYAKRPVVVERVEQVMEMIKPHKKKVKKVLLQSKKYS